MALFFAELFGNERFPAIIEYNHTDQFVGNNFANLIKVAYRAKFTPAKGTYTDEEWEEWERNRRMLESGELPPPPRKPQRRPIAPIV